MITGLRPAAALSVRELTRLSRQPTRIAATIGTPVMLWLLLQSGLSASFTPASGDSYNAYLLPGMMSLVILFSAIFAAISLIEDKNAGFLQAVLVSPAPRWSVVAGKVVGGGLVAWIQAMVLLAAAPALGFMLSPTSVFLIAFALLCESIGVIGLCLAAAWWVNSPSGFHGVMNLLLMPMWLLSGAFFALTDAAAWIRALSVINPLAWPPAAMRHALTSQSPDPAAWIPTIIFAILGFALASVVLGRRVRGHHKGSS